MDRVIWVAALIAGGLAAEIRRPVLDLVSVAAHRADGNLRDPSPAVRDPATGRWHFWVDFIAGSHQPGWHAALHHYSAEAITGPWRTHGQAINHSADPAAWDSAGTFSPSALYSPDERLWYLFYSASSANQSALLTCAQMVASASSPDGPWTKLGVVGQPTGSPPAWGPYAWNARRLDSGRALVIGGRKGYWTKGVSGPVGKLNSVAQEGLYRPVDPATFRPPWKEFPSNPIFPTAQFNPPGYENCEFFMGPPGEAGEPRGLLHVICCWHGNPFPTQGHYAHIVVNLTSSPYGLNWRYVESISPGNSSLARELQPGEPTPVYEGVPGDQAAVNYFIARMGDGNTGAGALSIGVYRLTWV